MSSAVAVAIVGQISKVRDPVFVQDFSTLRGLMTGSMLAFVTDVIGASVPTAVTGWFLRDDNDITSADDNANVIVATNGKRWKRITDAQQFAAQAAASLAAIPATIAPYITKAQNWATYVGGDVPGEAAGSRSSKSWAQEALTGALGGSAKDWAQSALLPDGANKSAKSYATDAQIAQGLAQAAADLAAGSAKIVSTTAQGLLATSNGQQFLLRTTVDLYTYDVYYNNAGVATLLGQITWANGTLYKSDSGSKAHHVFATSDDKVLGEWTNDGLYDETSGTPVKLTGAPAELELNTNTTTLFAVTDANNGKVVVVDDKARIKTYGIGDMLDEIVNDRYYAQAYEDFGDTSKAKFYKDRVQRLKQQIKIDGVVFYYNAQAGVSFGRMPTLLPLTATTGLVFFSQRNSAYNNGEEAQRAVCCSYTINYATSSLSFGPIVVVYQRPEWTNGTPGGWVTNPIAFVVRPGQPNAGRIYCIMNTFDSTNGLLIDATKDYYIVRCYSDDGGATWSAPATILNKNQVFNGLSGSVGGIPGLPGSISGVVTGTGNCLIRLVNAPYANRLVVSLQPFNGAVSGTYQGVMYSDNEGVTWTRGNFYNPGGARNENVVVERLDGSLIRYERQDFNDGVTQALKVGYGTSINGGVDWTDQGFNLTAAFGSCSMTALLSSRQATDGISKIFLGSQSDSAYGMRDKWRLRMSYDGGLTFPAYSTLGFTDVETVGYSFGVRNSDGNYLFVYEVFNGPGAINTQDSIKMMVVNEAAIFSTSVLG